MRLTESENIFAKEYVANGFNAAAAHRVAYPNSSTASARTNAGRIRDRKHVRAKIDEIIKAELGDLDALATKALHKISTIAFAQKGDEDYMAASQLKALELLQKQLGLQTQNIKADVKGETEIVINILGADDADGEDKS